MDDKTLRKLQLTQLKILKDMTDLMDENDLDYFLVGGTLLGAVRHKGFIPWDDDIDIAMPRTHYNRFIKICMEKLDEKYFLHCSRTDPKYWLSFIKIKLNDTIFEEAAYADIDTHKGIFIDVFPLDNAGKQTSSIQRTQSYLKYALTAVILRRRGIFTEEGSTRRVKIAAFASKLCSLKCLLAVQQWVMSLNKNFGSAFFVDFSSRYDHTKETIPKDKYYPIQKIEFEGEQFNAPSDYDYILKRIYDDYWKLPAEEDRETHDAIRIDFGDS